MDQLDERDRQAFLELQEKLVDQTRKKKQVAAQLRSCDTEQKRAVLTAEELNNLPDDAKTYEQIGRAYFLMPKLQLLQDRKDTALQVILSAKARSYESCVVTFNGGRTALMYAARYGHLAVAHMLLSQGSSPSAKDNMERNCLRYAMMKGHLKLVELLLAYAADELDFDDKQRNAEEFAAQSGQHEICACIRKKNIPVPYRTLEPGMVNTGYLELNGDKANCLSPCSPFWVPRFCVLTQNFRLYSFQSREHVPKHEGVLSLGQCIIRASDPNTFEDLCFKITRKGQGPDIYKHYQAVWLRAPTRAEHIIWLETFKAAAASSKQGAPLVIIETRPQEQLLLEQAQQLFQVQHILATDVLEVSELAAACQGFDKQLAEDMLQLTKQQSMLEDCKAALRKSYTLQLGDPKVLEETHANMHVDFEGQEQKHAENLTRDIKAQSERVACTAQEKTAAQAAIASWSAIEDQQKQLLRTLAKAEYDLVLLRLDEKHREAERVEKTIAELTAAKAALALGMEAQAQLLASSELLDDHPELHWDKVAASASPQLGVAKSLLVRDRKFSHFRSRSAPAPAVT
ncbi:hypothetical protein WJX82_009818 [Trebouxia sp. C0006]